MTPVPHGSRKKQVLPREVDEALGLAGLAAGPHDSRSHCQAFWETAWVLSCGHSCYKCLFFLALEAFEHKMSLFAVVWVPALGA